MSYKRKGQLAKSPEWMKHLRNFLKRQYWKKERKEGKREIRRQIEEK